LNPSRVRHFRFILVIIGTFQALFSANLNVAPAFFNQKFLIQLPCFLPLFLPGKFGAIQKVLSMKTELS